MTLTEQWKKGELERGRYYIKYRGNYMSDNWHGDCWEDSWSDYVEEVLAPVPSYEEWQELKEASDGLSKLMFKSLMNRFVKADEERERLSEENQQLRKWCEEFNALDVAKENQQLKEMLYKCREKLDWLNGGYDVWGGELTDFIEEIDDIIGEKK